MGCVEHRLHADCFSISFLFDQHFNTPAEVHLKKNTSQQRKHTSAVCVERHSDFQRMWVSTGCMPPSSCVVLGPYLGQQAGRDDDDDDYSLCSNECPCCHDKDYTDNN